MKMDRSDRETARSFELLLSAAVSAGAPIQHNTVCENPMYERRKHNQTTHSV